MHFLRHFSPSRCSNKFSCSFSPSLSPGGRAVSSSVATELRVSCLCSDGEQQPLPLSARRLHSHSAAPNAVAKCIKRGCLDSRAALRRGELLLGNKLRLMISYCTNDKHISRAPAHPAADVPSRQSGAQLMHNIIVKLQLQRRP